MDNKKIIIDLKELSLKLGISVSMIRKLIYNNEIPTMKIGNRYYFHLDIIDKWLISKHNDIEIGGLEYAHR